MYQRFGFPLIQIFKSLQKLLPQGYRYHKLRKTFGKFFRSNSELLSKLDEISFQVNVSKKNLSAGRHLWPSLQTKEGL